MNLLRLFDGEPATPEEILQSRMERAQRQRELLATGAQCVISFTLNIPGPVKQFTLARRAFQECLAELHQRFFSHTLQEILVQANTGNEALLAIDFQPEKVKLETTAMEEFHPLGRLFDIDVLSQKGIPISRTELGLPRRRCLLCGETAQICARSQAHSLETLQLGIAQMLNNYFRDQASNLCAACAVRSLLYEVSTTPKPGLVDRQNSGSHTDMDFFTFLNSSAALSPWFREMFCIGWDYHDLPTKELFLRLKYAGQQAESDMFRSTKGVNTHKGLIFSLGILCGALGAVQVEQSAPIPIEKISHRCRELGQCSFEDFSHLNCDISNGISCFKKYKITGARGEAAEGFPIAIKIGLPSIRSWLAKGFTINDAAAITLLKLIEYVNDTNMVHRGGITRACDCKRQAHDLLAMLDQDNFRTILSQLDQEYIHENLSPGGCADLLAISLMMFFLEDNNILDFGSTS